LVGGGKKPTFLLVLAPYRIADWAWFLSKYTNALELVSIVLVLALAPGSEENRQRINRHQEGTYIEDRGDINRHDSPHPASRAEQTSREVEHDHTCSSCEQRTEEAHAELVRAEIEVLARMKKAMAGPLLKYPGASAPTHPSNGLRRFQISSR